MFGFGFGDQAVTITSLPESALMAAEEDGPQRPPDGTVAIRVFVAAHVRLYREALVEILSREDGVDIVGASGDRQEILAGIAEAEPDVVLFDPAATESVDMIRAMAHPTAKVRVVAMASSDSETDVIAYAEAGVSGFVTCDESLADLVATIRRAAQGDLVVSPKTAGTLLRHVTALAAERPGGSAPEPLTARELDVAQLLDEGLSNQQIAQRLFLELPTVKHHVHHILQKLRVARRSEAVAQLRRRGLLIAGSRAESEA